MKDAQARVKFTAIDASRAIITYDTPCGMTVRVGEVLEPSSENPGLKLYGPLGLDAVAAIVEAMQAATEAEVSDVNLN